MNSFAMAARRNAERTKLGNGNAEVPTFGDGKRYGYGLRNFPRPLLPLPFRGMGNLDYYGLLAAAGGLETCDPKDIACVANNVAKQAAVETLWTDTYMTQGGAPDGTVVTIPQLTPTQVTQFTDTSNPNSGGNVVATLIPTVTSPSNPYSQTPNTVAPIGSPATSTAVVYHATFNMVTSRGGVNCQVGDSWKITITGAKPNAAVRADSATNGTGNGSANVGNTDGAGSFTLGGTFTSAQIGNWHEVWYVDGVVVGDIWFNVAPATASPTPTTQGGGTTLPTSGGSETTNPNAGGMVAWEGMPSASWFTQSMVGGVPNWMLLAGGAVVLFMMKGR